MKVIETRKLTRSFGTREAITGLDLTLETGGIYALLGPNGAGKTTTLKTLMNIHRPTSGEARVLGTDSRCLSPKEFTRIGYVSEDQEQPDWMRIGEFLDYCSAFYPSWDAAFARKLSDQFGLDPSQKLKELSRGTRMKAALISSLAYRPQLLVLDEPFNGLDPLVREEFIEGILELTQQEQWTVLISSHDVDEVEKLADQVCLLDKGKLRLSETLEGLQGRFRRISLRSPSAQPAQPTLPSSWFQVEKEGNAFQFICDNYRPDLSEREINGVFPKAEGITASALSLREIFVALARHHRTEKGGDPS